MTSEALTGRGTLQRRRVTVRGVVQCVGFRPFVARLANMLGLVLAGPGGARAGDARTPRKHRSG
nr:acylphosphatase [Rhodococcus xishaensis]